MSHMQGVMTGISVFNKLWDLFDRISKGNILHDKQVDLALKETHVALVATQAYLRRNSDSSRDPEKESELSGLWYSASIPMRHVNVELADILNVKGGYWSNPDVWNELASENIDITIENVTKLTSKLLHK